MLDYILTFFVICKTRGCFGVSVLFASLAVLFIKAFMWGFFYGLSLFALLNCDRTGNRPLNSRWLQTLNSANRPFHWL